MKNTKLKFGAIFLLGVISITSTACDYRDYVWRMECAYQDDEMNYELTEGNTTSFETFNEMRDHCVESGGLPIGSGGLE